MAQYEFTCASSQKVAMCLWHSASSEKHAAGCSSLMFVYGISTVGGLPGHAGHLLPSRGANNEISIEKPTITRRVCLVAIFCPANRH